jgi:hypothetical protein
VLGHPLKLRGAVPARAPARGAGRPGRVPGRLRHDDPGRRVRRRDSGRERGGRPHRRRGRVGVDLPAPAVLRRGPRGQPAVGEDPVAHQELLGAGGAHRVRRELQPAVVPPRADRDLQVPGRGGPTARVRDVVPLPTGLAGDDRPPVHPGGSRRGLRDAGEHERGAWQRDRECTAGHEPADGGLALAELAVSPHDLGLLSQAPLSPCVLAFRMRRPGVPAPVPSPPRPDPVSRTPLRRSGQSAVRAARRRRVDTAASASGRRGAPVRSSRTGVQTCYRRAARIDRRAAIRGSR